MLETRRHSSSRGRGRPFTHRVYSSRSTFCRYASSKADGSRRRAEQRRGAGPRRRAETSAELCARQQAVQTPRWSAAMSPRRHEQTRLAVLDRVHEPADRRRDHRAAVGHRLARDDAVALAPRRDADDGRPLVVRPELGSAARSRPPRGHRRARRRRSRAAALPSPPGTRGSPSRARGGRRRARAAVPPARRPSPGSRPPLGITRTSRAPSSRAASARNSEADDREPRPAQDRPEEPRRPPRELDVRAPELDDVRLAGRERGEARTGASARGRGRHRAQPVAPPVRSETRKAGRSSASHGRRRRLPTIPWP